MPRIDDIALLAILVREALRKAGEPLSIDHQALKAALRETLAESDAVVLIQSTRPNTVLMAVDVKVDPLFAASEALKASGRRRR